jgi:hypothetical protein
MDKDENGSLDVEEFKEGSVGTLVPVRLSFRRELSGCFAASLLSLSLETKYHPLRN